MSLRDKPRWVALSAVWLAHPTIALAECIEPGDAAVDREDYAAAAHAYRAAADRPPCAPIRALLLLNSAAAAARAGGELAEPCGLVQRYDLVSKADPSEALAAAARRERQAAEVQCRAGTLEDSTDAARAFAGQPSVSEVIATGHTDPLGAAPPGLLVATEETSDSLTVPLAVGSGLSLLGSAVAYGFALRWQDARIEADRQYALAPRGQAAASWAERQEALEHTRTLGVTAYALLGLGVSLGAWSAARWLLDSPEPPGDALATAETP